MPTVKSDKTTLSNSTAHWRALDAAHHIHPFTEHESLRKKGVRVITRGDGIYLWDSEGNRFIDGMAGLWCCQLGYGNEELAETGYKALKELAYYNTFFQTTHPNVVELSAKLAAITPDGFDSFFFGNSGSEANDTAVKFIRYYWNLEGKPNKKIILSREKAYHGVTMAAASLSGLPYMHKQFDLPIPGIKHVGPAPYWYGEGGDLSPDEFGLKVARHGLQMPRIQRCELRILVGIVVTHGRNHTVFQSAGNLGIMIIFAARDGAICDSKGVLDDHRTHY